MTDLRILCVAGCRPNFVKLGPVIREMRRHASIHPLLVHTGQHYDHDLSGVFFRDLELPRPDVKLAVGSGSQAVQTARAMEGLESALVEHHPDLVLVVGDVNSTVAAALTAVKLGIPVAHVEAGLRSFDREMPEEINRLVTDTISDFLFATEPSAVENLHREGIAAKRVWFVGNVMVDALLSSLDRISASDVLERLGLQARGYAVVTLHRAENVDDPLAAGSLVEALEGLLGLVEVAFPVHPRTRERLHSTGLLRRLEDAPGLRLLDPLGYLDFLKLVKEASLVATDSGGLQEECTVLGVPCLTMRDGTERPCTVIQGTNRIVGKTPAAIVDAALRAVSGGWGTAGPPDLWDGHAAERIVGALLENTDEIKGRYRGLRGRALSCGRTRASAA
ncbi:MAG TPA: UDP-N-acetylglucosamine 2-epimerase (non-hydrolyzing) [Thermoanaerobaculia bacterium]|nr:UDP-N-acetylglucosamine 2-epimerase (non-hydrolyzing) [Thermoanaerobaculia bacterium]